VLQRPPIELLDHHHTRHTDRAKGVRQRGLIPGLAADDHLDKLWWRPLRGGREVVTIGEGSPAKLVTAIGGTTP
jgi:hypothetical protein